MSNGFRGGKIPNVAKIDIDKFEYHGMPMGMGGFTWFDRPINLPKKYIINKGATVLFWEDGTKTIVKRAENDNYNKILGFLWAYFQYTSGLSKTKANKYLAELLDEDDKKTIEFINSGDLNETLSNMAKAMGNAFSTMADNFKNGGKK